MAGNVDYYLVANSSDERRNLVLSFSHASTPVLLDIEKGDMVQDRRQRQMCIRDRYTLRRAPPKCAEAVRPAAVS